MPTRPQIELTREELDRAEIPLNHVLVKIVRQAEGLKTNAGITVGFNTDLVYAEGDDSHSANMAEVFGIVTKIPGSLYFNPDDPKSMDWETTMDLIEGDMVWYSALESKNSVQLVCDGVIYKSIPFSDCFVAKRTHTWQDVPDIAIATQTICLNGYVLCSPCFKPKLSDLDHLSQDEVDKTRGVIKFIGDAPKRYLRDIYSHIADLRVGDEVLFDPKVQPFYLERLGYTGVFDNGKQYLVVPRRRINMILNRKQP